MPNGKSPHRSLRSYPPSEQRRLVSEAGRLLREWQELHPVRIRLPPRKRGSQGNLNL